VNSEQLLQGTWRLGDGLRGSRFFRQAAATYGTQLLMAVFGLASTIIVARALGPAGRGEYAVAVAIGAIGVQLFNLGLPSANSYFVARDRTLLPSLLANALCASFLFGAAAALAVGVELLLWGRAPLHGPLLWFSVLWIPVGLAYLLTVNLLMGLLEVRLYNIVELLNRALATALVIGAVLLGARTPAEVFLPVLLGMIFGFGIALLAVKKFVQGRASLSFDLFRRNFHLGWKAYLSCLFCFLLIRIDLLMVKSMQGSTAAGYYSISGSVADYLFLLPVAVGTILFPKLSGMLNDEQKRALTVKAVVGTGLGLLALLVTLGLSASWVVPFLFGRAFAPAVPPILLLLPGILFMGLQVVMVQYVNSRGFPVSVVVLWVLTTVLNIGANLWTIPRYGINGAAVVSSISYLLVLLGVIWITWTKKAIPSAKPLTTAP
jgi:O-antigen/teichoic acid export membrane protein